MLDPMDVEPPTIPATAHELAAIENPLKTDAHDADECGHNPNSNNAAGECLEDKDYKQHASKKRRVLRAASSLAPETCADAESFCDENATASPTVPLNASEIDAEEVATSDGASAALRAPGERKKAKALRAASSLAPAPRSLSQSTWRDSPSPAGLADDVAQNDVQQLKDDASMPEPDVALNVPRTALAEATTGTLAPTLVVESGPRHDAVQVEPSTISTPNVQLDMLVDSPHSNHEHVEMPDLHDAGSLQLAARCGPAEPQLVGNDATELSASDNEAPTHQRPTRRRIIGKQKVVHNVPALFKHSSALIRESLGHCLRPPEAGFLVRVKGDGWGGGSGGTSYLATVTEADALTYTVIRRGDCHGSWDETHVLKEECTILARTTSRQDVCLRNVRARCAAGPAAS